MALKIGIVGMGKFSPTFGGVTPVHPVHDLPEIFRGLPNRAHGGSHAFLVNAFVRSLMDGQRPPGDISQAANWAAAGLLAHESALQGGRPIRMPDFAKPTVEKNG